jgi:peptide/nickel transport system ATP-binding protein
MMPQMDAPTLLEVKDLVKHFPIQRGLMRRVVGQVKAVDGVSFAIRQGETLGLVGESGCGKTTTGRVILRALDPTSGQILYRRDDEDPRVSPPQEGQVGEMLDLAKLSRKQMRPLRKEMQIIFQDPFSSLNPRLTVLDIVTEPLRIQGGMSNEALRARGRELLEQVGLRVQHMNRYPYAFSGGQRQRIGIARALALKPRFIVCDEPVSALDVSIQAQVLNLLRDLQSSMGLTYLFISHDLSVVEHVSDRVAVMYLGSIVELAPAQKLYAQPQHPYTEALLSAVPSADPDVHTKRLILPGDVPSPSNPPPGCKFHPRCRYAEPVCSAEAPAWREIFLQHWVACHRAHELDLAGIVEEG